MANFFFPLVNHCIATARCRLATKCTNAKCHKVCNLFRAIYSFSKFITSTQSALRFHGCIQQHASPDSETLWQACQLESCKLLSGKNAPAQNSEDSKENVKTEVNKFKATTLDYYSTTISKSLEGSGKAATSGGDAVVY